jgi:broad specificity phosphatase PhoE
MRMAAPLRVYWLRHAQVASHRGDLPVTDEGRRQVEEVGQQLSRELISGEIVSLLHAPTRRTHETALMLHSSMITVFDDVQRRPQIPLSAPIEHRAIRNPDIYVAGTRIELVSTPEALAEQLPSSSLGPQELARLPFLQGFWEAADRIGYWVNHPNPPGEDADTVARRLLTFAVSLLDLPRDQPRRYICVTHSPPIRAFLRRYVLGYDPGEPGYLEAVDVDFDAGGSFIISYRGNSKKVAL